jgi:hypothetical protein
MLNSLSAFRGNIKSAREIGPLHDYLVAEIGPSMNFDDLLRSQIVYSVSAFDKLIHDIVKIGIMDIFIGKRPATPKFLSERITMEVLKAMNAATIPPKEFYFEQHVVSKLKMVAYQDPDRISDGLSFIWNETSKWHKIAGAIGSDEHSVKTTLRLIVNRRNSIVHEADIDLATGKKQPITKADCESTITFLEKCGEAIVTLVV